jgi:hypothetical protein
MVHLGIFMRYVIWLNFYFLLDNIHYWDFWWRWRLRNWHRCILPILPKNLLWLRGLLHNLWLFELVNETSNELLTSLDPNCFLTGPHHNLDSVSNLQQSILPDLLNLIMQLQTLLKVSSFNPSQLGPLAIIPMLSQYLLKLLHLVLEVCLVLLHQFDLLVFAFE